MVVDNLELQRVALICAGFWLGWRNERHLVLKCSSSIVWIGTLVVLHNVYKRKGGRGLASSILDVARLFPGFNMLLSMIMKGEVDGAMKTLVNSGENDKVETESKILPFPEKPIPRETILEEMKKEKESDGSFCHDGKAFALVYYNEQGRFEGHKDMLAKVFTEFNDKGIPCESTEKLMEQVFREYSHGNALNPLMFPALRKFETEVISMCSWMLNGDANVVGAMTSGGTESILMVIKAYREMAREKRPDVVEPEIIVPYTIHPAHDKAGHYFGVKIVHVKVDERTQRPNPAEIESLINRNTIGIALSAPQYSHCVIDPIEEVSEIAVRHGIPLHVDACYGGFMLPWLEKLGYKLPKFDFRVPGVCSMTVDAHKYGYVAKGASLVLFRNEKIRKYMYYAYSDFPGGLYISPSMAGTRPGANIAMAWATLRSFGQQGYMEQAREIMETTEIMTQGVRDTAGIELVVEPQMSGFAVKSSLSDLHIFHVADEMEKHGWKMERQSNPDSLHCSIMPSHANQEVGQKFVDDLKQSVSAAIAAKLGPEEGSAAIYGMAGKLPAQLTNDFLVGLFSEIYKLK